MWPTMMRASPLVHDPSWRIWSAGLSRWECRRRYSTYTYVFGTHELVYMVKDARWVPTGYVQFYYNVGGNLSSCGLSMMVWNSGNRAENSIYGGFRFSLNVIERKFELTAVQHFHNIFIIRSIRCIYYLPHNLLFHIIYFYSM